MRSIRCLVLAASACGRVGFAPGEPASTADAGAIDSVSPGFCASATFSNPGTSTFVDTFSTTPFTDRWQPTDSCIFQGTGELISAPPESGAYCHAWTLTDLHLTCDSVTVRVRETTRQTIGAQTLLYIYRSDGPEAVHVLLEADGLQLSPGDGRADYDADRDVWWRLREHDGVLFFETAPDGTSWSERMRVPTTFSLDHVEIALGAGTWTPTTTPGQARFACLNTPPPCT